MSFAPKFPEDELTLEKPFRAPIRPYWSMTQLVAIDAYPASNVKGESCVFSPKKPGA